VSELEQPWRDEEWLRKEYHDKEKTQQEVAEAAGCSKATIKRWMKRLDVPRRSLSEANADGDIAKLRDEDWLREHYFNNDLSARQIAKKIDSNNVSVLKWIDNHGIERKHRSEVMSDGDVEKLHSKDWLEQEYSKKERPATDIADECGVDSDTVYIWLRKHDLEVRTTAESRYGGVCQKLQNKDWLQEKYIHQGLSTRQIADLLNVGKSTVTHWMREHDISARSNIREAADRSVYDYEKIEQTGPNWEEKRLEARIRDQCRCQFCGMTDKQHLEIFGSVNIVHHIKPRGMFVENGEFDYQSANQLDNLITLCTVHHGRMEGLPIDSRHL